MAMKILAAFGMDYSQLPKDLAASESLLDSWVNRINQRMASVKGPSASGAALEGMAVSMQRLATSGGALESVMTRMGRTFSSGIGLVGIAAGFATLERAFDRAIKKAEQFQTVTISIGASLTSAYKFIGGQSGKELSGKDSFLAAMDKAGALNKEILKRQAKNILTYEEEVRSFQAGILPGSKKGLTQEQVLNLSEKLAVVAKSAGVSGERIPQEVRLALGGGANISRSIIGRLLGVSNKELESKKGDDLVKFYEDKTKGFSEAGGLFATSIKAQITTFTSKLDQMLAGVGQKAFANIGPMLGQLSAFLDKGGADKIGNSLAAMFTALFKILQNIVQSGALDVIAKFLDLISSFGGELVIIAVLGKLASLLGGLRGLAGNFTVGLAQMAAQAEITAVKLEANAAAMAEAGAAGKAGVTARGGKATGNALTAASSEALLMGLGAEDLAVLGLRKTVHSTGQPVLRNMKGFEDAGKFANQGRITSAAQQYIGTSADEAAIGAIGAGVGIEASAAEARLARIKAGRLGAANKMMGRLGQGAQGLMMGVLGGEAISGMTEDSKSDALRSGGRFVSGALEAGLAAGMATGNPIVGVVVGGVAGIAKMIKGMFDDAEKPALAAQAALEKKYAEHPILRLIDQEKAKIERAKEAQQRGSRGDIASHALMNTGQARSESSFGGKTGAAFNDTYLNLLHAFGAGDYASNATSPNILTAHGMAGSMMSARGTQIASEKRLKELRDALAASTKLEKEETNWDDQIKRLEAKAATEKLGEQTLPRQLHGLDIARQLGGVKLDKAAAEGGLALDSDINVMTASQLHRSLAGKNAGVTGDDSSDEAKQKLQAARQKMELTVVAGMESAILKLGQASKEAFMNGSKYLEERFAKQGEAMKEASSLPVAERNKYVSRALGEWDRDYKEKTQDLADRIADERDNLKKNRIDRARLDVVGQFDNQTWGLQQQKMALEQQKMSLAPQQNAFQDEEFGMQERGLYQSRQRAREDQPFKRREAGFGAQMAGLNADQAQMSLSMYGQGAPQYQAMESAIRYKVDAQIGQDHPITPGQYEDNYKKSKDMELTRLGIEVQLTDDAKKRAALNVGRVEEDYVNALQQITHSLTGVGLAKQNAGIDRKMTAINQQEQGLGYQRSYFEHGLGQIERTDQAAKLDLTYNRQRRALGRDTRAYSERGGGSVLEDQAPLTMPQLGVGLANSASGVGQAIPGGSGGGGGQSLTMKIDVSGTISSKINVGGTVVVDPKDLEKHINKILDAELPKIIATDLPPILERIRKRTP